MADLNTIPIASRSITFGPIPSRRLGRSLGVNNLLSKRCSYNCGYCQAGATREPQAIRQAFHPPDEVIAAVEHRLEELQAAHDRIDYVSFVPDGEPTLDVNLGIEIRGIRALGARVAVITSGSLLWMPEVRAALAGADLVSIEVDAATDRTWRRINRPHRKLDLSQIELGMLDFAAEYRGELLTQTMLVAGINDDEDSVSSISDFLGRLHPKRAYLAVPTRPPADERIQPADAERVVRAHALLSEKVPVELLLGVERGSFGVDGDATAGLLAILAVHPMRDDAVSDYVAKTGGSAAAIEELIRSGRAKRVEYSGRAYLTLAR